MNRAPQSLSGHVLCLDQQEGSSPPLSYPLKLPVKAVGKMPHRCLNEKYPGALSCSRGQGHTVVKMLRWEKAGSRGSGGKSLFGDVTPLQDLEALSLSDLGECCKGGYECMWVCVS